jgi:hypothetical protein
MLTETLTWLGDRGFAQAIAGSAYLFPSIETVHVIAITLVAGTIAMLDLRLLGVSSRNFGVMQLAEETLPWTWGSFAVAVVTGFLLFSSKPLIYYDNIPFRCKMVLLLLAGINMAIFHMTAYRRVHHWNHQLPPPRAARIAASLSLIFWIGVIFFGRWIGFTAE